MELDLELRDEVSVVASTFCCARIGDRRKLKASLEIPINFFFNYFIFLYKKGTNYPQSKNKRKKKIRKNKEKKKEKKFKKNLPA